MLARERNLLYQHLMLAILPGVKAFTDPLSDRMGGDNMARKFQDHRLEDNEPLRVPPYRPHPPELVSQ